MLKQGTFVFYCTSQDSNVKYTTLLCKAVPECKHWSQHMCTAYSKEGGQKAGDQLMPYRTPETVECSKCILDFFYGFSINSSDTEW